ncbi:MAG: radical SAM protein [Patescibacteria group bacterium]
MKRSEDVCLDVETDDAVYEIRFGQIQIEITGRCNMYCQHCRAANQSRRDMPIEQIVKIIRFARQFSSEDEEIVLSGGEPFIHRDIAGVLKSVRANGGNRVTLTTNGSLLTADHLRLIEGLHFTSIALSVSLDSVHSAVHDAFRGHKGAFVKANDALRLVAQSDIPGIVPSMRSTVQASQIDEMEDLVRHARNVGCKRIGFSAVHPAGRAIGRQDLWLSKDQKKAFLRRVYELQEKYPDIAVSTSDPLKCLVSGASEVGDHDEIIFDGCGAAAVTFNVDADGTMTPCALLDIPMMNVFDLDVVGITERYRRHQIVKDMLSMNLKGKCGACQMKYQCGGCRARAFIQKGDYLEEDPHCWT